MQIDTIGATWDCQTMRSVLGLFTCRGRACPSHIYLATRLHPKHASRRNL